MRWLYLSRPFLSRSIVPINTLTIQYGRDPLDALRLQTEKVMRALQFFMQAAHKGSALENMPTRLGR